MSMECFNLHIIFHSAAKKKKKKKIIFTFLLLFFLRLSEKAKWKCSFFQNASECAKSVCQKSQNNCSEVSVKNCWHELKLVDFIHYQVYLKVTFHKALLPFMSDTVLWHVLESFVLICWSTDFIVHLKWGKTWFMTNNWHALTKTSTNWKESKYCPPMKSF